MENRMYYTVTNDKNKLKQRLKEAKIELLEVLEDWHYLQNILKPRLDFTYDAIFGDLEFELSCRINSALELDRRIEIVSYKINKGEKINSSTFNSVNIIIDRDINPKNDLVNNWNNETTQTLNTEELSGLYRQLVKKIHPDSAGENNEYLQFWDCVQSSYKSGNVDRIKLFYQTICKDIFTDELSESDEVLTLSNEIKSIETNISNEKMKIAKLKNEEPFCFQDRFKDQVWINSRMKQIQDRILYTDMKIQRNKRYLSRYEKAEPMVSYYQPSQNTNNNYKKSYAS